MGDRIRFRFACWFLRKFLSGGELVSIASAILGQVLLLNMKSSTYQAPKRSDSERITLH